MSSMKYWVVSKVRDEQEIQRVMVMACNYIEAQFEGEHQMRLADVQYDAREATNDELAAYFSNLHYEETKG